MPIRIADVTATSSSGPLVRPADSSGRSLACSIPIYGSQPPVTTTETRPVVPAGPSASGEGGVQGDRVHAGQRLADRAAGLGSLGRRLEARRVHPLDAPPHGQ